jgi:nucleoside 2-deoxyribosyltransferase
MGIADSTNAWMDVQIFEMIHNAGVVVVDLTGVRPNCFTEMGYAFGRARKVIVTAKEGTVANRKSSLSNRRHSRR